MREYTGGYARTTVAAELRPALGPRRGALRRLAAAASSSASPTPARDEITDVVSCPGTDSCKLGITSSMGLNRAIQERVEAMEITDPLTRQIHIKMSGCPNGCSQHHIANIGFYGASLKVGGRQMPAYIPHLGGNYEGGEVIYGHRLKSRLPAKRVPDAVERWLRIYEAEREDDEEFNDFVERDRHARLRGRGQGPDPAGRVQPRDDDRVHRLEPLASPTRSSAARASARSEMSSPLSVLAQRAGAPAAVRRPALAQRQRPCAAAADDRRRGRRSRARSPTSSSD